MTIHTLNTCLQPVEGIYEYNYPSLVELVYWFEGELGGGTPLCQALWELVQNSMPITFIDGRVVVCALPEVCPTSRGHLGRGGGRTVTVMTPCALHDFLLALLQGRSTF